MTSPLETKPPSPTRKLKVAAALLGLLLLGAMSSDLFLQMHYGLGHPPVVLGDPEMEYFLKPDAHYVRRGKHIDINHYAMRSEAFPPTKSTPDEKRVVMIGDSIINGGAQTDQSEIVNTLLEHRLREDLHVPAIVGNASAASWGPQNELAWANRFGLLDADVVVIVVSSHDATDEIGPLPKDQSQISPNYHFAWAEVYDRWRGNVASDLPMHVGKAEPCLAAFNDLIAKVQASGAIPIVVFHYEKPELSQTAEAAGHAMLRAVCERRGLEPVLMNAAYAASLAAGHDPYRDYIHPNPLGQRLMADVLTPLIEADLRARHTPTSVPASQP